MQEERQFAVKDIELLKILWKFGKPYFYKIILTFLLLIVISLIQISLPYITKSIVDNFIEKSHLSLKKNDYTLNIAEKNKAYSIVSNENVFIPSSLLSKGEMLYLKKDSLVESNKFILFKQMEKGGILDKYELNYVKTEKGFLVDFNDLKMISKDDLKTLRGGDLSNIRKYALFYVFLLLISFVFTYMQVILMAIVSERIMYDVRSRLTRNMLNLSMNFFNKNPIGRLTTRVTNDVDALRELLTDVFVYSAKDILTIIGIFIIMFKLSLALSIYIIMVFPFLILSLFLFQKYARKAYRNVRITLARVNSYLSEAITGVLLIKAFNQEEKSQEDFKDTSRKYYNANMYQLFIFAIFRPLIDVFSYITLGIMIYFGGRNVIQGNISIGVLIAFISYIHMLFRPIFDFSEKYNIFQSAMASAERIYLLLNEKDSIDSPEKPIFPDKSEGTIEFKNVSFEYKKGEKVLDNVSFTIRPNESVAFVGATGAGKTTIINLLMRFYDATEGEILIDGINIKNLDISFLRNYFGLVLQDIVIFSGDVKYNIALNNKFDDEKIMKYSKYVNAHYFIEKLENKYNTKVMERGSNFSTGQRQLISFARALIKEPKVLILDEATSSIDSETEYLIQDAIRKIMHDKTSIAIAHRLSTIQDADRIYVMQKGRVVETGSHNELLNKKGYYYELYTLQYLK